MSEVISSPNQPPTITQQQLFEFFPFLENTQNYPQASVQAYLSIAGNFVDRNIWGSVWAYGVALVTAHLLTIVRLTNEDIAKGGFVLGRIDLANGVENVLVVYKHLVKGVAVF